MSVLFNVNFLILPSTPVFLFLLILKHIEDYKSSDRRFICLLFKNQGVFLTDGFVREFSSLCTTSLIEFHSSTYISNCTVKMLTLHPRRLYFSVTKCEKFQRSGHLVWNEKKTKVDTGFWISINRYGAKLLHRYVLRGLLLSVYEFRYHTQRNVIIKLSKWITRKV